MSVLIDLDNALDIDFSEAFVYPDACFLLAYLDSTDRRGDHVAELIDLWTNRGVTLGLSTHIYSEVVSVLLRNTVLRSLEIQRLLHTGKKNIYKLTAEEHTELVHPDAAQFLLKIGVQINMIDPDRGKKRLPVVDLLKSAKERNKERHLLEHYYSKPSSDYTELVAMINSLGISTEYSHKGKESSILFR